MATCLLPVARTAVEREVGLSHLQCLHQARVFIDRDFEGLCEQNNMEDKLQALDVMCIEQGITDGEADER